MYLSDRDIRANLDAISFDTGDSACPFEPDEQIQPSSVDLRLDGVFWRQRRGKSIDLRRSKLLELSPRRYWTKVMVQPGETITLKPGEMILGRTFESFAIPLDCAGKLEGRSSFGRMGLSVHCTADFINPGWSGRMPLELVNMGSHTLRLFAHVPICQVVFVRLSSTPLRAYGDVSIFSKYLNDDGGPSYWWRDKRIEQLHSALAEHDASERVQLDILDLMGPREPDLIERFERMISRLRRGEVTNAADLLDRFAAAEDRDLLAFRVKRGVLVGLAPGLITTSIGVFFTPPYSWLHWVLWAVTVLSMPISIWALTLSRGDHLGTKELEALRCKADVGAGLTRGS